MYICSSQELADKLSSGHERGEPLETLCAAFFPNSRERAFQVAEFAWNHISIYRSGMERMIAYFLTDTEISEVDGEEKEYWRNLLDKKTQVHGKLKTVMEDKYIYGNSFSSLLFPFTRKLKCPSCHTVYVSKFVEYEVKEGDFILDCPNCSFEGKLDYHSNVIDDFHDDPKKIHIIRWSPYEIEIQDYDPITQTAEYFWKIPDSMREAVAEARSSIESLPKSLVEAASKGEDFKFDPEALVHLKFEGPAGIQAEAKGWGIPPILSIFSDLWFRQLINRSDQSQALSGLNPLRILTPALRGQSQSDNTQYDDPTIGGGQGMMNMMMSSLEDLVHSYKSNPAQWHALSFPVQYGALGGEGYELIQPELGEYMDSRLLGGMGVPVEFFDTSLQWQATPEAMRVLERSWSDCPNSMNYWLDYLVDRVSTVLVRRDVKVELKPPSVKDEMMRRQILMQLYQTGDISRDTAFEPWNIDFDQDIDNQMKEVRQRLELEKRKEQELDQEEKAYMLGRQQPEEGAQGAPPPGAGGGGVPGMGGMMAGAGGGDIHQMTAQAEELAQQLLQLPETARKSELHQIKQADPTLHHLVTGKMQDMRSQIRSDAYAGAMDQIGQQPPM